MPETTESFDLYKHIFDDVVRPSHHFFFNI